MMTPNVPQLRRVMIASFSMLILVSCTTQGDFGRDRPSVFNDEILPSIRNFATSTGKTPVSKFALTEKEQLLRNYSRRLGRDTTRRYFISAVAPAQTPSSREKNKAGSGRGVEEIVVRLPESAKRNPYALNSEIEEDVALIRRTRNLSRLIVADDKSRLRRLAVMKNASQSDWDNVTVRARENLLETDYIRQVARVRIKRYRRAIDVLSITDPQLDLEPARASVKRLGAELDRFSRQRRLKKKSPPLVLYDSA